MSYPKVNLFDICRPKQWKTISSTDLLDSGYAVYGANGKIGFYSEYTHKNPTLMITCRGATCGNVHISEPMSYINGNAMALDELNESQAYIKYLYYYFKNRGFDDVISGSAQPQITGQGLTKIKIPLPPLAEQKRIAAILDKADAIRRKRQQAIQLADDFLRSVFLDMFGDPVTNPKGWEVRNLDSCLDFLTSGSRGWAQYYSEQGDKFIRIQNVGKNKLLLADMAYINAPSGAEAIRTKIKKGDVLLSITADLGRASVVTEDISGGFINQHLAILRVNQNQINPRYLAAFLSSDAGVRQFTSKNKSAVKAGLNFSDIKSLAIALPPLKQKKKYEYIYEKLEQLHINNFKDAHQSNSLFNSLSQKAFSGQL